MMWPSGRHSTPLLRWRLPFFGWPAVMAFADERGFRFGLDSQCIVGALGAQQCLSLRPLPHGHGSLRPIFRPSRRRGAGREALACDRRCGSK